MTPGNSFHSGELAVQRRAGETEVARRNGRALSNRIPDAALPFLSQQPMVVVGSVSRDSSVWASVLTGRPGFLQSEDGRSLYVDISEPRSVTDDPLWNNLHDDAQIGILVIELGSRRRLRINGRIRSTSGQRLIIEVEAAYPNCPKYIQRRYWKMTVSGTPAASEATRRGSLLTPEQQTWVGQADTLFVASAHPEYGADVSHRGGKPGFVEVMSPRSLRIPDYAGNSMFNTLGNFECFPHAGLAFVDFEHGRLLQLSGRPAIRWDVADTYRRTGGTGRFWDLEIEAWQESMLTLQLNWEFLDYSRFNPEPMDSD